MKPPKQVSDYLTSIGSKGGSAGKGESKARTTEQATKAAKARWAKHKKERKGK